MASARNLQLVDRQTGEITTCRNCHNMEVQLEGAEKDIRAWRARYANLKAEVTEDEGHELFPSAKRTFDFWREACKHPRTKFTVEHFKACLPYLRDYGEDMCRRAIEGAAYDPFTTKRKNGTVKRHDGWTLIFQNPDKFTEFANRAPYHLPDPQKVHIVAKALLFSWPEMELHEAIDVAQRTLRR